MNQNIGGVKNRRNSALNRLENQLKSGKKAYKVKNSLSKKGYSTTQSTIPLEELDIKRINKEIEILKTRI